MYSRMWRYISGYQLTQFRFINNEFVKAVDGKTFETINPSTEKPIVAVQEATEKGQFSQELLYEDTKLTEAQMSISQ